ncbi:MAG: DUF1566 domain-containing protein [Thermodesulfovibrionales bacterium]
MPQKGKQAGKIVFAFACLVLLFTSIPAESFFLPDTGQTTCYSSKGRGNIIPCPQSGNPLAQDGTYTINPPSFTANDNGSAFDNNTWLMWQQEDDGITRTWAESKSYCDDLTLGGYTDWRLPEKKELESIVNYEQYSPAIDLSVFPNTKADNYWSSTTYVADTDKIWIVSFGNGAINNTANTASAYTRCVRGGPLEYDDLLMSTSGVTDESTELMWTGNINSERGNPTMKWEYALAACESLVYGQYSDWRLPNVRELESLTDDIRNNPSLDKIFFSDVSSSYYWTSTTNAASTAQSWAVSFQDGTVGSVKKRERDLYVMCVRTEKKNLVDTQEIKTSPSYLDFGYVKANESKTFTLTISNVGLGSLSIGNISYPNSPFAVTHDGCSNQTLSVWESCAVTVNLTSGTYGVYTDSLLIVTNDSDHSDLKVNMSATVTSGGSIFLLPDTALQYCFESLYPLVGWTGWFFTSCGNPPAQDASYDINLPNYNVLNADIVTDQNTGLMWQRTDDRVSKRWEDAVSYCNNLNLSGYTGWRLPSRTELFSIIDDSHKGDYTETGSPKRTLAPKINAWAFPGAQVNNYWTSSEPEESRTMAWNVSFVYGTSELVKKDTSQYTRCVRGGGLPSTNLLSNGNGTLTDKSTSHMWQQGEGGEMTWTNAAAYCENLSLGGYLDWRLPNVKELEYISMANKELFPAIQSIGYWSSTTNMYSSNYTWVDSFDYAYVVVPHAGANDRYRGFGDGEAVGPVRCVRGGNPGLLKVPVIMVSPSSLYFGSIDTGTSSSQNFYISNIGGGTLIIGTITAPSMPFSITSDGCSGRVLSASMSCAVTVKFTSITEGTFTDNIAIPSNDAAQPNISVGLSGTATLPSGVITGVVTDSATGLPLPNVTVTVSDSVKTQTAATGANGAYALTGLAQGSFTATFEKSGYIKHTTSGTLTHGQTLTLNVQLTPVPALALTITSPQDGAVINSSTVTVTGTVTNSASVSINAAPASVSNGAFTATISLSEGQNTITATANDIYSQTSSTSITVTVVTKGTISGTVTDSSTGLSLFSAMVSITDSSSATQTVLTDTNGSYAVSNITSGAFSGNIIKDGYTTYSFSDTISSGQTIIINAGLSPIPPTISNIAISNITTNSATITWTTDQPSDSLIQYGTTTSYGSSITDSTLTTSHSITLTNLTSSTTYHFRVTSTNSYGFSTTSGDNTFTTSSPPSSITLTITSPLNGETINKSDVIVKGTVSNTTGNETGITVNGIIATVDGNKFVANHVPLTEGSNTITATAKDTAGNITSTSITVNASTTGDYIKITLNIESGIAPLEVTLKIDGSFSFTHSDIMVTGPAQPEVLYTGTDEYKLRMTVEGTYYFEVSVTGPDGNVYKDTIAVTVLNKTELDNLLKAKWEGMKGKLTNSDMEGALSYYFGASQERYRYIFTSLLNSLPDIAANMQAIEMISIGDKIAEYRIKRIEDEGEVIYYIYFVSDENGLWKILQI